MGFGKAKTNNDGTRPWEAGGRGEARMWYRRKQDKARVEQSQTGHVQNRASQGRGRHARASTYL